MILSRLEWFFILIVPPCALFVIAFLEENDMVQKKNKKILWRSRKGGESAAKMTKGELLRTQRTEAIKKVSRRERRKS